MALDDHVFGVHLLQPKINKMVLFNPPNFILHTQRGLLELSAPPITTKKCKQQGNTHTFRKDWHKKGKCKQQCNKHSWHKRRLDSNRNISKLHE
jgi:hypothetical protein